MKRAVPSLLRSMNSAAVLKAITEEGSISRTRLSRKLGISLPTIKEIIDNLKQLGIIGEVGRRVSIGRPASDLGVLPDAAQIICLDVGVTSIKAGRFNFHKQLVEFHCTETLKISREGVIDQIVDITQNLIVPSVPYKTVVIGVPGFVSNGVVVEAPNLPDWHEVPLLSELRKRLDIPVSVENDVNLAALGEVFYGAARNCENVVFLSIGTGVGSGIVIKGQLLHGSSGAAGEISFLVPGLDKLHRSFGDAGAFEESVAMRSLVKYFSDVSGETWDDPMQIMNAAHEGNEFAYKAVAHWADYIGIGLTAIGALLNPEMIIIGGDGSKAFNLIKDRLYQYVQTHLPIPPTIAQTALGNQATLWGGVTVGIELLVNHLTQVN